MPNTVTVQNVVSWAQLFVRLLPVTGVGGVTNEPALTIANQVQQTLLSPPFGWRYNRSVTTFNTAAGTQDTAKAVTDVGWIEHANLQDAANNDLPELEVRPAIGVATNQGRPISIAPLLDDGTDTTFRLFPVPDAIYSVAITYQKQAPLITALTATWVLPDHLAYLYRQGVLAGFLQYANDPRAVAEYQKFIEMAMLASSGTNPSTDPVAAEAPAPPAPSALPPRRG